MKRSDILSRIIELVRQKRVNGKLDLISDDYPDKRIECTFSFVKENCITAFQKITVMDRGHIQ